MACKSIRLALLTGLIIVFGIVNDSLAAAGHHRGELYFHWGYNWSAYTGSDIRFRGSDYDFTLHDVTAHDRPTRFAARTYLNPAKMTVPQYDLRIGYYIGERTSLSLGMTHLKYVVTQGQGTTISGTIGATASGQYAGDYDNTLIQLDDGFLRYEHTDGLNYGAAEAETLAPVWESRSGTQGLYALIAGGVGIVTPKSDVTLFGQERSDRLHLAGWGINAKIGLRYEFRERYFLQYFINVGRLDLANTPTRAGGRDVADQTITFLETAAVAGMSVATF